MLGVFQDKRQSVNTGGKSKQALAKFMVDSSLIKTIIMDTITSEWDICFASPEKRVVSTSTQAKRPCPDKKKNYYSVTSESTSTYSVQQMNCKGSTNYDHLLFCTAHAAKSYNCRSKSRSRSHNYCVKYCSLTRTVAF